MPLRLQVDPGGEYLLPWAKRKLVEYHNEMLRSGEHSLFRTTIVSDGARIYTESVTSGHEFIDFIRITAGAPEFQLLAFEKPSDLSLNPVARVYDRKHTRKAEFHVAQDLVLTAREAWRGSIAADGKSMLFMTRSEADKSLHTVWRATGRGVQTAVAQFTLPASVPGTETVFVPPTARYGFVFMNHSGTELHVYTLDANTNTVTDTIVYSGGNQTNFYSANTGGPSDRAEKALSFGLTEGDGVGGLNVAYWQSRAIGVWVRNALYAGTVINFGLGGPFDDTRTVICAPSGDGEVVVSAAVQVTPAGDVAATNNITALGVRGYIGAALRYSNDNVLTTPSNLAAGDSAGVKVVANKDGSLAAVSHTTVHNAFFISEIAALESPSGVQLIAKADHTAQYPEYIVLAVSDDGLTISAQRKNSAISWDLLFFSKASGAWALAATKALGFAALVTASQKNAKPLYVLVDLGSGAVTFHAYTLNADFTVGDESWSPAADEAAGAIIVDGVTYNSFTIDDAARIGI